ncbi:hypothetical protein TM49_04995 [Martelella endophytica]|uniref:Uncharacterized protein n=2 Tax=Martelella endophytica TaxID=1486262 RepID=A0A0D5LMK2_MAREN|nr:hypothetical protein TM49_04995 [Martelella endophytica]
METEMAQLAAHSHRNNLAAEMPPENQIVRDSYLYLHWNGILTNNKAESEMATFAGAALIEPGERWKPSKLA